MITVWCHTFLSLVTTSVHQDICPVPNCSVAPWVDSVQNRSDHSIVSSCQFWNDVQSVFLLLLNSGHHFQTIDSINCIAQCQTVAVLRISIYNLYISRIHTHTEHARTTFSLWLSPQCAKCAQCANVQSVQTHSDHADMLKHHKVSLMCTSAPPLMVTLPLHVYSKYFNSISGRRACNAMEYNS